MNSAPRQHFVEFLEREYARDLKNFSTGIKPPAALRAAEVMLKLLEFLHINPAGIQLAWTFRSKGIRVLSENRLPRIDPATKKPFTIGRRCAMYIRLPCEVESLGLHEGDFMGILGNVSTQSTNVFTSEYFVAVPYTDKLWIITGVLNFEKNLVATSSDDIIAAMNRAVVKSEELRAVRAERQERNENNEHSGAAPAKKQARHSKAALCPVTASAAALVAAARALPTAKKTDEEVLSEGSIQKSSPSTDLGRPAVSSSEGDGDAAEKQEASSFITDALAPEQTDVVVSPVDDFQPMPMSMLYSEPEFYDFQQVQGNASVFPSEDPAMIYYDNRYGLDSPSWNPYPEFGW